MALREVVGQIVVGLGFDLVELERSASGLLRVTIDWPWSPEAAPASETAQRFVSAEDCETVTRQLQFALEVDAVDYRRLEVSSPGIDRPLRQMRDFERFVGLVIDVTLKAPIGAAADGKVNALRKKFRGVLERRAEPPSDLNAMTWQIVWRDEPAVKPGVRVSKKRVPAPLQALGFTLDELKEARLAPIVNFKGRGQAGLGEDLN
ncbi:MAG: ribosome maturation factor RimP [Rhodoferax sp.]|nr:ribosome maturation factor RimP [Rhodoferax sp.]